MKASEYIAYLLSEPYKSSYVRSSQLLAISHDQGNGFLCNSDCSGKHLLDKVSGATLRFSGRGLSMDEVVRDKPFGAPAAPTALLVGYFGVEGIPSLLAVQKPFHPPVFLVLRAFEKLMLMAKDDFIESLYQLHHHLFLKVQRKLIQQFA